MDPSAASINFPYNAYGSSRELFMNFYKQYVRESQLYLAERKQRRKAETHKVSDYC